LLAVVAVVMLMEILMGLEEEQVAYLLEQHR
jgi:hypothetical protein